MKRVLLLGLMLAIYGFCFSSNSIIDSLETELAGQNGEKKLTILFELAQLYRPISLRKSIEFGLESYNLALQQENSTMMGLSLNVIGQSHFDLGNYKQALSYHLNAIDIFGELKQKTNLAKTYNHAGQTHLRLCNYDRSLYYFLNSLQINQELQNNELIVETLNNIAQLYHDLGNYNQAIKYYSEALEIQQQIGDNSMVSAALHNLGSVHSDRGDQANALELYMRCLQLERLSNNKSGVAITLCNLGKIYKELGETDKALDYLEQSLDLALEIGSKYEVADIFLNIGQIQTKLRNFESAFANLTQGLQISNNIKAKDLLREGYRSISEYFTATGNTNNAFEYYRLYSAVKDKIARENSDLNLLSIQTGFSNLNTEKEIALEQKERIINKLTTHQKAQTYLLLLCVLIAALSLSGFLYYRIRQKNLINDQLRDEIKERKTAEGKVKHRLEIERVVSKISSRFIRINDFDKAIRLSMDEIGRVSEANRVSLYLMAVNSRDLEKTYEWFSSSLRFQMELFKRLPFHEYTWLNKKLRLGEIIHVSDSSNLKENAASFKKLLQVQSIKSSVIIPINFKGYLAGFISFDSLQQTEKWQQDDLTLLGLFAETIGLFFERKEMEDKLRSSNVRLESRVQERTLELAEAVNKLQQEVNFRNKAQLELSESYLKLKKAMEETVNALVSAVEIRDPYTAGHQLRVATLSREIALAMGFKGEELDAIRTAAILHDIGKIYIPAEILTKPGKLDDNEYEQIKKHPLAGYDILKTIDFDRPIAKIVHQHHEHLDGSGYPQGLIGNEILLEARIVNVADVVDAMISQRPYRTSQAVEDALSELQEHAGIRYDEDVVKICIDLFKVQGFHFEEINFRTTQK
jgi:putative nucleotidyltransferase with HDIG domain